MLTYLTITFPWEQTLQMGMWRRIKAQSEVNNNNSERSPLETESIKYLNVYKTRSEEQRSNVRVRWSRIPK